MVQHETLLTIFNYFKTDPQKKDWVEYLAQLLCFSTRSLDMQAAKEYLEQENNKRKLSVTDSEDEPPTKKHCTSLGDTSGGKIELPLPGPVDELTPEFDVDLFLI